MSSQDASLGNYLPCTQKAVYGSKKEANAAALLAENDHNVKLKSYKCTHCKLWHLASFYK